jgi:hypothetical protein
MMIYTGTLEYCQRELKVKKQELQPIEIDVEEDDGENVCTNFAFYVVLEIYF